MKTKNQNQSKLYDTTLPSLCRQMTSAREPQAPDMLRNLAQAYHAYDKAGITHVSAWHPEMNGYAPQVVRDLLKNTSHPLIVGSVYSRDQIEECTEVLAPALKAGRAAINVHFPISYEDLVWRQTPMTIYNYIDLEAFPIVRSALEICPNVIVTCPKGIAADKEIPGIPHYRAIIMNNAYSCTNFVFDSTPDSPDFDFDGFFSAFAERLSKDVEHCGVGLHYHNFPGKNGATKCTQKALASLSAVRNNTLVVASLRGLGNHAELESLVDDPALLQPLMEALPKNL